MGREDRLRVEDADVANAAHHPGFVHIPDTGTEGLRSYKEPETPHPLQVTFLSPEGERAFLDHVRSLCAAGRFDEAAEVVEQGLAPFDGRIARHAKALLLADILIEGWEDLAEIIAEFEGPDISAITAGLGNEPDLVFDLTKEHEPMLLFQLYSDDVYDFSARSDAELLAACEEDCPGWAGEEEDVEFYVSIEGFAPLNTALIQCKHVHFLRDGRDGVEGRAPGGYVEYQLGCWLRCIRYLQALRREVETHGLPEGVRLLAGTFGLNTDCATILGSAKQVVVEKKDGVAPVATLTMGEWVPKHDPLADMESGASLRQRIATSEADENPAEAVEEPVVTEDVTQTAPPEKPKGFFARMFERLRG